MDYLLSFDRRFGEKIAQCNKASDVGFGGYDKKLVE